MKFRMKQSALANAFSRLTKVATTDIKSEFKMSHRISIDAQKGKVLFLATNGHLDALTSVTDECEIDEAGQVVVDAIVANGIIQSIGKSDHQIEVWAEGDKEVTALYLNNLNSSSKRKAKMQVLSASPAISISKPKKGFSYTFAADIFINAIHTVAKYKTPYQYSGNIKYMMICLHFLPDRVRFICGCGMRFAVLEIKSKDAIDVEESGQKYLLPAPQATLIASTLKGCDDITLVYKDAKNCYIEGGNTKMNLKGIPEEEYINYENHAFRFADSLAVVDVPMSEYISASQLVGAVRDKENENEGDFHSCRFEAAQDKELILKVEEGRYQTDSQCDCKFYPVKESKFVAHYSHMFLDDLKTNKYETLRFFCIDPDGIIIAEPISIDHESSEEDSRVEAHCPAPKMENDYEPRLSFFFAAASEE